MKRFLPILTFIGIIISCPDIFPQTGKDQYSPNSVLRDGRWFKVAVTGDGIYRIDFTRLKQLGLSNPANPRIFGNNFGQLSFYNDDPKPDDLKEIPLLLNKGTDNIFNEGDYLLFYGEGTNKWKYKASLNDYDYVKHNYSDTAYYFLTSSPTPGKIISNIQEIQTAAGFRSSSYDALYSHEVETENLIKSGREWYQPVSVLNGITINPGFADIITSEKMEYKIRVAARASIPTLFRLYEGTVVTGGVLVPEVYLFSTTGTFANISDLNISSLPASSSPAFEMRFFNNGEQGAKGWIDYVRFKGRSMNNFTGKTLKFSDSKSVKKGLVTQFNIKSAISGLNIWDVTDPFNTGNILYTRTGDSLKFNANTDSLKTFIAFTNDKALAPSISSYPLANQDLHASESADMVIVTHPLFRPYAEKLAYVHQKDNGLKTLIVTPEEIYNEFSGGSPDIVAIRNFLRMKYLKQAASTHPLRYLLLFGDGSYQNRLLPPHNPNFVPTYQSQNSTIVVSSFTSDDFYGLLDNGEGEADGTEDIGIGRFPVTDTVQAGIMVSKVAMYLDPASTGSWRNQICITADDGDGNTHLNDAEGLSSLIESDWPTFIVNKIYLDAFQQVNSVSGKSYPDVNQAINDRINAGCLIFNYVGHGNETGLSAERVVKTEDINAWKNKSRLPLFITATCEFSRFDDAEYNSQTMDYSGKNSAGEMVLLNRDGGGIALMTTTRVVYSAPNYTLNRNIYKYAFTRDINGETLGLGDIIKLAKINSGSGQNKRNFTLLGDPAVKLSYPASGKVITDNINNKPVNQVTDSLKALSMVTITGHVEDNNGNRMTDFNGVVYPLIYDKASKIKTLANDGGPVTEFNLRNNTLFSGKTLASNGKFSFTFIVPKDIDYTFGKGKIDYYAYEADKDLAGEFSKIIVGGFSRSPILDTTGPVIKLYLNDTLFRNGGMSDNNPVLLSIIEDSGGINTTGSGIGHDLQAFIDNEKTSSLNLNNYFETDYDNYRKGSIRYPLGEISSGSHSVTLKAWDNFNNSSQSTVSFVVRSDKGFMLNNLINYPNPFINNTSITAEHNRPDRMLTIRIRIYNMGGKLIKFIETTVVASGYKLPPVIWDGNTEGGSRVGRGIYPYSVTVSTEQGESAKASGRMLIL
jgi:hypothetical protein